MFFKPLSGTLKRENSKILDGWKPLVEQIQAARDLARENAEFLATLQEYFMVSFDAMKLINVKNVVCCKFKYKLIFHAHFKYAIKSASRVISCLVLQQFASTLVVENLSAHGVVTASTNLCGTMA